MFMNRKENIIKVSIPPNYCIKLINSNCGTDNKK